jgi:DNA-binding XRE family transcriptional regulator
MFTFYDFEFINREIVMNENFENMENYLVLPKPADIRGARAYLNWKQMELAYKCGVSIPTITAIETEKSNPTKELLEKIAQVFAEEDVYFLSSGGHKVEKNFVKMFKGRGGPVKVLQDVIKVCGAEKDEILVLGSDDSRSDDGVNKMYQQIYKIGIGVKLLMDNDNNYILGPLEDYRCVDKEYFLSNDAIYIYGDKIMFVSEPKFKEGEYDGNDQALLIENAGMAEQFRAYFYRLWEKGKKPTKSSVKQIFFKNKEAKGSEGRKSAE